ncbi:unnamed protein product, partial [Adineta steineri]
KRTLDSLSGSDFFKKSLDSLSGNDFFKKSLDSLSGNDFFKKVLNLSKEFLYYSFLLEFGFIEWK